MKLDCFDQLALKTYNTAIPAQSGVFCTIALHKEHPFNPADIVSVEAEVSRTLTISPGAGDSVPSTMFTPRRMPTTACRGLMAVALLDGDVQPAQLELSRIEKRGVQDAMQKVTVRPDAGPAARCPADLASRVTVRLKNGTSFTQEISDFPGAPARPFYLEGDRREIRPGWSRRAWACRTEPKNQSCRHVRWRTSRSAN